MALRATKIHEDALEAGTVESTACSVSSTERMHASKLFRDEQSHGFALVLDHVLDSIPYILVLP